MEQRRLESSSLDEHQMEELETLLKSEKRPALVDSSGNRTELPKPIFEMLRYCPTR